MVCVGLQDHLDGLTGAGASASVGGSGVPTNRRNWDSALTANLLAFRLYGGLFQLFQAWPASVWKHGERSNQGGLHPGGRKKRGYTRISPVTMRTTSLLRMAMGAGALLLVFALPQPQWPMPHHRRSCRVRVARPDSSLRSTRPTGAGAARSASPRDVLTLSPPRTTARTACPWSSLRSRCSAMAPPSLGRAQSASSRSMARTGISRFAT